MNLVTVPIGGVHVSADPTAVLVTYGLGSCVAVMAWDRERRAGGLLHFQLPSASLAPERARETPGAFGDSGFALLLERLRGLGCDERNLTVKLAGGGTFHGDSVFDIGRRNCTAIRKVLWRSQLIAAAEDLGGGRSRTARLFVDSGHVTIQSGSEVRPL